MLSLDRLRTFRVVADELHFRRAADKLHLSQSAVSQQIGTLEAELGVMLIERIGRRVYLTPAGRTFAEEAAKILAACERAVEAVRSYGAGTTGTLRLGASTTPGVYVLPAAIGVLQSMMPSLELAFRIDNSANIERALIDNELDLGVVGEDITRDELFQVVIAQDVIVAVASPQRAKRRVRAAELAKLPLLSREPGSATQRFVDAALAGAGLQLASGFTLPSPEAQVRAAAAGLGVAFVSKHVAANDLAAGRVIELAIEGMRLVRPITAAYHRDKRVTPAMQQLIDLARKHAQPAGRRR